MSRSGALGRVNTHPDGCLSSNHIHVFFFDQSPCIHPCSYDFSTLSLISIGTILLYYFPCCALFSGRSRRIIYALRSPLDSDPLVDFGQGLVQGGVGKPCPGIGGRPWDCDLNLVAVGGRSRSGCRSGRRPVRTSAPRPPPPPSSRAQPAGADPLRARVPPGFDGLTPYSGTQTIKSCGEGLKMPCT